MPLDAGIVRSLAVIFQTAAQLGAFQDMPKNIRPNWKMKLWALGSFWGLEEGPWYFDEFGDMPFIFDLDQVYDHLHQELVEVQRERKSRQLRHRLTGTVLERS